MTLNLSCPNNEDDPRGQQSAALARELSGAVVKMSTVPVWAKVGPDLSDEQLTALVEAFADTGVRAVVATNTLAQAVPDGQGSAGLSGARLRPWALDTVSRLHAAMRQLGATFDIVAGGGILDGADLLAFEAAGARAAMLYTALVFRGPLAAALILRESHPGGRRA